MLRHPEPSGGVPRSDCASKWRWTSSSSPTFTRTVQTTCWKHRLPHSAGLRFLCARFAWFAFVRKIGANTSFSLCAAWASTTAILRIADTLPATVTSYFTHVASWTSFCGSAGIPYARFAEYVLNPEVDLPWCRCFQQELTNVALLNSYLQTSPTVQGKGCTS